MTTQREKRMARVLRRLVDTLDTIPEADRARLGLYSISAIGEAISLIEEVERGVFLEMRPTTC